MDDYYSVLCRPQTARESNDCRPARSARAKDSVGGKGRAFDKLNFTGATMLRPFQAGRDRILRYATQMAMYDSGARLYSYRWYLVQ